MARASMGGHSRRGGERGDGVLGAEGFWARAIAVPYALGDDVRWAKLVNAIAGALTCGPCFSSGGGWRQR
jgi:hypothetical protein